MSNRQKRLPLLVSAEELKAIEEYRWRHRVPSFAESVRQLIAKGLTADEKKADAADTASAS